MTPQERDLLEALFERIRNAPAGGRDPEAEAFIAEAVRAAPAAPYLLSQTVIIQEETLKAAAQRIEELQAKVEELESRPAAAPTSFLGGIGRNIFGEETPRANAGRGSVPSAGGGMGASGPPADSPARWTQRGEPMPDARAQADQGAQPGGGGGSFLKGALGAAAGVAGGMLLANSLSGLLGKNSPFGTTPAKADDKPGGDTGGDKPWGAARDTQTPATTPASHQEEATDSGDEFDDDDGDDDWDDGDDV